MSSKGHQYPASQTAVAAISASATAAGPLSSFDLHGYRPSPTISDDETYMDIVMIITRSSQLRQGSMGCILVQPTTHEIAAIDGGEEDTKNDSQRNNDVQEGSEQHHADRILGRIIAAANNTDLFKPGDSDVHAEINAIGQVAAKKQCSHHSQKQTHTHDIIPSITTKGATAYITMPPCKKCFGALYASGISRIVSRRKYWAILMEAASKGGIEMKYLTEQELADQKVRLDQLFAANKDVDDDDDDVGEEEDVNFKRKKNDSNAEEEITRRRKERKEEKRARKVAKIAACDNDVEADTKC